MQKTISQDEKYDMMTEQPIPLLIRKLSIPTIISMLITSVQSCYYIKCCLLSTKSF
ncbi:MAG: hypothetical protein MSG78_11230 [Clostridiales bacterium]|nr:hypothetical protein [Clostridiales bacterium]